MTKKAAEDDGGRIPMDQGSVQPAFSFGELLIGPVHIEGAFSNGIFNLKGSLGSSGKARQGYDDRGGGGRLRKPHWHRRFRWRAKDGPRSGAERRIVK